MKQRTPLSLVWAIIAVFAIVAMVVVAIVETKGFNATNTPIIVTLVGLGTSIVTSLFALFKVEGLNYDVKNGLIPDKVKEALDDVSADAVANSTDSESGKNNG